MAGQSLRMATATTMSDCSIVRLERLNAIRVLHDEQTFSELFLRYLLSRNIRIEEDLVDQLFNSSEKRLARVLLLLAKFGKEGTPELVIPKISEETLAELVGVPPDQGAAFFDKLLAKDDGWMASLFDALARINGPVKDYLTDPPRMKRFYMAVRGRVTSPGPARPVFRSNADMMLLTTRLRMDANGRPVIPGGIEVWKNLFITHPHGKYDGKLTKAVAGPLEGAGQWTHQYADPANTCCSTDNLVQGPLGMLWFRDSDLQGPSRHGRGPAPGTPFVVPDGR